MANVTVVGTGAGLVLVDTSNYAARDKTFAAVRAIDAGPVHAALYTHGHADHALGLPPFLAEAILGQWMQRYGLKVWLRCRAGRMCRRS